MFFFLSFANFKRFQPLKTRAPIVYADVDGFDAPVAWMAGSAAPGLALT